MLRLAPPEHQRISFARQFDAYYVGGEANVAVSLANYGIQTSFVSKLPAHALGDAAVSTLRGAGVGTEYIARGGERIGVYYLEHGASVRASKVIYDRTGSAISQATDADFDFQKILHDAEWLHISGITPALSDQCARLTKEALQCAKAMGITTSFDLNYRKKLWTSARAQEICIPLMKYVDVCIGNEEDMEHVLGVTPSGTDVRAGTLNIDGYKQAFKELEKKFAFQYIATTLRESISASDNGWSALLYDGRHFYQSQRHRLHIVDRVGGGDSFSGALIYSLLTNKDSQYAVEFATAASALKHTIHGDFNQVSVEEVEGLAAGDSSGRVVR